MATKKSADGASATKKTRSSTTRKATARKTTKKATKKASKKSASKKAAAPAGGHVVVEREIGGRTLTLETGRLAKLSDGAVLARYGDTVVFAAANSSKAPDFMDFFPLTVDYREKMSAAGVIPGGFFKREGRPNTKEILTCRIIDRSIRPMFPDGFRRDVQVLSQCIASDRENDGDILAAIASFAALAVSSLPHGRSLGMVRMGYIDDELVVNPTWSQLQSDENKLNLTVAGHSDAVVMVEAGAKEVKEDVVLEALAKAHEVIKVVVEMVEELAEKAGKPKMDFEAPEADSKLEAKIEKAHGKALRAAPLTLGIKQERQAAIKEAKAAAEADFAAPADMDEAEAKAHNKKVGEIIGKLVKQGERESILDKGVRADGRDTSTVRPITIEVGVLPRVHGSVLFTRGETQALGVVTLGGTDDQQIIDGLMPEPRKRFLLHYAFPPFSVGETKRMLAPGRREIGHGALAERGLEPLLPSLEEFPYTIRVTSEIMESNGSSSMATACAGTLSMMDAGVPIKQPVAGIAMGLVMEGKDYAILSDILGSEDACGDMDFKVVGTGRGITALQMDIKCEGLTREILAEALEQAKEGRLHILREMLKALRSPRKQLSPNAPRLESVQVPSEKIGLIIGPGGKNIRSMQEEYEVKISIEDSGLCTITGVNGEKVDKCLEHIKAMTAEVELGTVYTGRVTAIKEFGAFVEILPGQEGLVHVSELSNEFIRAVTDVVRIGDEVEVKVIAIDDFGKVKLSRKALMEPAEGGAEGGDEGDEGPRGRRPRRDDEGEERPRRSREERGDRGDRGDREERRPRRSREWDEEGEGREERPARGRRPRRDDEVEDRPRRPVRDEDGEREERRPRRGRRDERDDEVEARDDAPRRGRRPRRDDEGEDRPRRPRRDDEGEDRPRRPRRDDEGEDRPRRPRRDDEGEDRPRRPRRDDAGDDRPRRPRRDYDEDRPRRPRRDDDDDRPRRSRRDDEGDERPRRSRRRDEGEDRPRRPRRDDEDERPSRRGGRSSSMPMAEFDEGGKEAGFGGEPELESIDSVIGDGEERPRRGRGRRPRRRD
jgi:polyribonucleotide nucleotidyltransferase